MAGRRRLRAVLFDVDDTLYSTTEFSRRAREAAARAMIAAGLGLPFDAVMAELDEVVAEFPSNFDRHYDALLLRLPASACGPVNPAVIVASGVVAYHQCKQRELAASAGALETLRWLRARGGLKLGVVTSGLPVKQAEKLVRMGLLEHLDPRAVFFAEQMGYSKANPKLYAQVCRVLDLAPGEVLHVGDHPVRDVDSPKRAGLLTALFRSGGKYSAERGATEPDYVFQDLRELPAVLDRDFETCGPDPGAD
jgi:putative hydrolase of the HAD superfamily